MTLTVGHITYLNCAPFFDYLPEAGFCGSILPGVPAELNRLLETGEIDVSPSSSWEYGRHWRDYLLVPEHSISCRGAVKSVLLFTHRPLEELEGGTIYLTGESATSVNLLHILLREFYGFSHVACEVPAEAVEEKIGCGEAGLLIGDRALRADRRAGFSSHRYDLGELWFRHTGLPFVFALWILRRQAAVAQGEAVRALMRGLHYSRSKAFGSLEKLADRHPEKKWMGRQGLIDYWRCMSYDLTDEHLEGLRLFFRLAVRHRLLEQEPELHFFS